MTRRIVGLAAALGLVLLPACAAGEAEAAPFAGLWESRGFGLYFDVHGSTVDIYEHSAEHCVAVSSSPARGMSDLVSLEDGTLVLEDGLRLVVFDPIAALPAGCVEPADPDDALEVFDVAAATVQEHYVPGVPEEWVTRRDALRATLTAASDDAALLGALTDLLAMVEDPELRLATGSEAWSVGAGEMAAAIRAVPGQSEAGGGRVLTRSLGDEVVYLAVLDLVAPSPGDQRSLASGIDGALDGVAAVVLDLRGPEAGLEPGALLVASRFVSTETVVAARFARDGDGLTSAGDLSVVPLPSGVFGGEVVVLVGPETSGPAELLAMILGDLPGVTLVGEPTAGSPRGPLARTLPNGWVLGVPNVEVIDGEGVARAGVPLVPDVSAPTTPADLAAGRDQGLDAALQVLGGR